MPLNKIEVGKRLRKFVESNFNSIKEFSEKVGVHQSSLNTHYFSGKSIPGGELLNKLMDLGCDIEWLLTGKEDEPTLVIREFTSSYSNQEFPILAKVPAGNAEIKERDHPEYKKLEFDPRTHFWLEIDDEYGYSMTPMIIPGDMVLCSTSRKFQSGDLVAIRWDKTKGAVKIITFNPELKGIAALESINRAEPTMQISKKQIEQIYKVVLILKK